MILCCGEAIIDMIPRAGAYVPRPGGAALNTAVALARLGEVAQLVAGLSSDAFGQQLEQVLRDNGAGCDLLIRSSRPTTLAFVHLSEHGDARYSFYDTGSAGRNIVTTDMPALPVHATAALFGGISLAAEPAGSSFESLSRIAGRDTLVMLDANIRPALIANATEYRARLLRMMGQADIIKLSDEDLDWLAPGSADAFLDQLRKAGATRTQQLLILTRGPNGAKAWLGGGNEIALPAATVEVADTVGAGDCFNAGLLTGLSDLGLLDKETFFKLSQAQLEQVLGFAIKVASISVTRSGADPPWRADL